MLPPTLKQLRGEANITSWEIDTIANAIFLNEYPPTCLLSDCRHDCNLRVGNMIPGIYIQIADIDESNFVRNLCQTNHYINREKGQLSNKLLIYSFIIH